MNELVKKIEEWGKNKGILDKATPQTQFLKLDEEVNELHEGIVSGDKEAISDAIGDCAVVLILMARLCDLEFGECLNGAYNEIKGRTGKMKDGMFVKDE